MTKRTAIIIKKDLPAGQIANISAILMAEVARAVPETLAAVPVTDRDGLNHAAPQFSVVVLKANGSEQLQNTAATIRTTQPGLTVFGFGALGQSLNNQFEVYREKISNLTTEACGLVGIAVAGEDAAVRMAAKKFSLF
jgi:hypothetical protein